jgi:hypothetical protein
MKKRYLPPYAAPLGGGYEMGRVRGSASELRGANKITHSATEASISSKSCDTRLSIEL